MYRLSVVCCLLPVNNYQPSTANYQLSTAKYITIPQFRIIKSAFRQNDGSFVMVQWVQWEVPFIFTLISSCILQKNNLWNLLNPIKKKFNQAVTNKFFNRPPHEMNWKTFHMNVEAIRNKLFRFAVSMLRDEAEAEDVVQEVVIKLWKQRDQLDRIHNMEAWTMRLTRNLSIDKIRSKHRRYESLDKVVDLQGSQPSPAKQLELTDTMEQLKKWITQLPDNQRLVFQLRDIEGMTYKEIGDTLDMPLSQVKINLFRARQQVRAYLLKNKLYE
jgi:RNA polymerase sigma factor (sigma-70 family)